MRKLQKIFTVALCMVLLAVSMAMAGEPVSNADELKKAIAFGGNYTVTADFEAGDISAGNIQKEPCILDLAGHTITVTNGCTLGLESSQSLTINDSSAEKTGKITEAVGNIFNWPLIQISNRTEDHTDKPASLTLNEVTLETSSLCCVSIMNHNNKLTVNGATLTVTPGTDYSKTATSKTPAWIPCMIMGNGTKDNWDTTITINSGLIDAGAKDPSIKGDGIYHPQRGILNINGGKIRGNNGVQFKGGTLNMTGGTIEAYGKKPDTLSDSSNGTVDTGAAISFVSNKNYAGNMELNISGTPVIKSINSHAIYEDTTVGDVNQTVKVNISGGTFTGFEADGTTAKAFLFRNWNNIATKSITGGTFNSNPKTYIDTAEYFVKEEAGIFTVAKIEAAPVKPEVPAETPAEEAAKNEPVTAVTPATNEEVEAAISGDIKVADLDKNEAGQVVVKAEVAAEAAKSALTDKIVEAADVQPLPVFTAPVADTSKVAMVTLNIKGSAFGELTDPAKIIIIKILANKTGLKVAYADAIAGDMNGKFILQNADDNKIATAIEAAKEYKLSVFIKDNGDFDLDKAEGKILDPLAIVKKTTDKPAPAPADEGGTGGCSAGFGALALICLVPFFNRRKNK